MSVIDELASGLRRRLHDEARVAGAPIGGDRDQLRERIAVLVEEGAEVLEAGEREELVERVLSATLGLGPLEPLLADGTVDEIMVNGPGTVLVERDGRIEPTAVAFESAETLMHAIERILAPLGRRIDEASPLVDARLPDGSRVNCVIPPLSLDGPVLTIRRFRRKGFSADELVSLGTLTDELRVFLERCVCARLNVVVCGGTGTGKTTLLNVLSSLIDARERIITIEDAAELRLRQGHVLRLESRPPNLEGEGEVTIRTLVRNALRRVETLALMADVALPHTAVREQIASALDVVVHLERMPEGGRRVAAVGEVVRAAGGVGLRELYGVRGGEVRLLAAPGDGLADRLVSEW